MGSIYINGSTPGYPSLKDVVKNAGLSYELWPNWEWNTRSSGGFEQLLGVVCHHTAGSANGNFQNDWSYHAVGHQDAPVANIFLWRDGHMGIHSGGASNHAGKGGPFNASRGQVPLDSGNSRMIGIEAANNGVGENWAPNMVVAYETLCAALDDAYNLKPQDDIAHFEWAPTRKIDPWGGNTSTPGYPYTGPRMWDMHGFRSGVANRMGGGIPLPPPGDDMLMRVVVKGANAKFVGMFDANKFGHTISWVRSEGEYDQYVRLGAPERQLNMEDLAGLILLGQVPTGDTLHGWTGAEFDAVVD